MPKKPSPHVENNVGDIVPMQPGRNGGLLRTRGKIGNRGGPGRPPSAVRARCLGSFDHRVETLEAIADATEESASDRIKAIDTLAKYGLGTKTETEHSGGAVFEMVVRHEVPTRRIS